MTDVNIPMASVHAETLRLNEGGQYALNVWVKPDALLGVIEGALVVHTTDPDQATIEIPVFALVQKGDPGE